MGSGVRVFFFSFSSYSINQDANTVNNKSHKEKLDLLFTPNSTVIIWLGWWEAWHSKFQSIKNYGTDFVGFKWMVQQGFKTKELFENSMNYINENDVKVIALGKSWFIVSKTPNRDPRNRSLESPTKMFFFLWYGATHEKRHQRTSLLIRQVSRGNGINYSRGAINISNLAQDYDRKSYNISAEYLGHCLAWYDLQGKTMSRVLVNMENPKNALKIKYEVESCQLVASAKNLFQDICRDSSESLKNIQNFLGLQDYIKPVTKILKLHSGELQPLKLRRTTWLTFLTVRRNWSNDQ